MSDQKLRLTTADERQEAPQDAPRSTPSVTIELDDRSFLFPQHKPVSHVKATRAPQGDIELSVIYEFNNTKQDGQLFRLSPGDCQQLCRKLVDGYYQGRTQNVLSESAKIGIVFNPNGFLIMFQQPEPQADLFLSPPSLLRLTRGLMKLLDKILPVAAH